MINRTTTFQAQENMTRITAKSRIMWCLIRSVRVTDRILFQKRPEAKLALEPMIHQRGLAKRGKAYVIYTLTLSFYLYTLI